MNKHSFFSVNRITLSACKLIFIITVFFSSTSLAQEQTPADLEIGMLTSAVPITLTNGQNIRFDLVVRMGPNSRASGVIVTADLPEGITPALINSTKCSYADKRITCNLGELVTGGGILIDYLLYISISLKPTKAGTMILTARITANEPDPNLSNNTATRTINVLKSRTRVRVL